MGATEEELAGVLSPDSCPIFSAEERVALRYAEELTTKPGEVEEETLRRVQSLFSPPEIVELTMAVCVFNVFNRCNEVLGAEIDLPVVPNAFHQAVKKSKT